MSSALLQIVSTFAMDLKSLFGIGMAPERPYFLSIRLLQVPTIGSVDLVVFLLLL
jgi:hypothetical protein